MLYTILYIISGVLIIYALAEVYPKLPLSERAIKLAEKTNEGSSSTRLSIVTNLVDSLVALEITEGWIFAVYEIIAIIIAISQHNMGFAVIIMFAGSLSFTCERYVESDKPRLIVHTIVLVATMLAQNGTI
jgi:hypothetical protein